MRRKENSLDAGSKDTGRANIREDGNGGVKTESVSCWDSPRPWVWNTTSQQEPKKPSDPSQCSWGGCCGWGNKVVAFKSASWGAPQDSVDQVDQSGWSQSGPSVSEPPKSFDPTPSICNSSPGESFYPYSRYTPWL